ncbi:MAG: S8 family serine peptidase [Nocardiopsaceae bacterium]|nr:S8 family serine peptidase [Nocardiopsaceae bacterium]
MIGLASAPLAGFVMPAHADTWRQSEWWLAKQHVIQAWASGEGGGITVAVLADGVAARQPDLTGRVISGPDFTGSKRAPGSKYYGVIGTGIASLIAGHGHGSKSGSGIYGVARKAKVLSVRVTLSPDDPHWSDSAMTSRLPSDIAAGIRYAVNHGASVIALPADPGMPGIPAWGGAGNAAGGSPAEQAAISYATKHNVMLVAPAGDNGQAGDAPNYPAAYEGVVAVGAFDKDFVKAPYSSHQRYVTLTAAGSGVVAATPSGYQTMNSTWAASAIVAGVASLLRSQFPDLTTAQAQQAMTHSTMYYQPGGLSTGSGYGAVNAAKALEVAATLSPPHAKPAGHGALPRQHPSEPSVPSNLAVISRNLLTDTLLALAVLACLLVPIMWYGNIMKRRERHIALAAADRAQHSMLGGGGHGIGADPMLDFFGPQEEPAGITAGPQRPASGPKYQPRPALSGRSTLTPAFAPRPLLPAPHPADAGAWDSSPPWSHADQASSSGAWDDAAPGDAGRPVAPSRAGADPAWDDAAPGDAWGAPARPPAADHDDRPRGSDRGQDQGRSSTLRHAPVAGTPPWEPAPEPTGELPWSVLPGPGQGPVRDAGYDSRPKQGPPELLWDSRSASQSAPPSPMFDPDLREDDPDAAGRSAGRQVPGPDRRSDSDWRSIPGRRGGSGERPIYIWDPDRATDDDGTIRLTSSHED